VNQLLKMGVFVISAGSLTPACGAPPSNVQGSDADHQMAATSTGNAVTNAQLPINQRFKTLDEYLAWLKKTQAPVDGAWYQQIRPGVYELQTGGNLRILGAEGEEGYAGKRIFTREQLEKQFGFRK